VTLATFYRHFPGKQDLILAYLQRVHDDFDSRAAAARAAATDPGDMLKLIGNGGVVRALHLRCLGYAEGASRTSRGCCPIRDRR